MNCCENGIAVPRLCAMQRAPSSIFFLIAALLCLASSLALPVSSSRASSVELPPALTADGIPPIPVSLEARIQPYLDYRSARFLGWNPANRSMLIVTRLDDTRQLYEVAAPGAARRQLTFSEEPVLSGSYAAQRGDVTLVIADTGGDEQFQIYRVDAGRMQLLTPGAGRNLGVRWTRDGRLIGYSTTQRTGVDTDLHIMDPRDPASDHMVMPGRGGGWSFSDFSADGTRAILFNYISVAQSGLYEFDVESRVLRALFPATLEQVSFGAARYGPDDRVFAITDQSSEYRYLAEIDRTTGIPRRLNPETNWSVDEFEIDPRGRFIAYSVNENGVSRLRFLDIGGGMPLAAPELPEGIITGLEVAPWGVVGFSMSSATSPGDAFSVDPETMAVTRWTYSETGGIDPERNAAPQLLTTRSFDGLPISGLLYRPDPTKFPGRRPLLVGVHGGPESQSRPGYLGRSNFLVNELGIALFFPNVRGSTGYGKTFVALDNGPDRRERSVRDIGAFLKVLRHDPAIDRQRMAITGGSYGGYMTLAALARYPSKFRAGLSVVGISNFVTFLERTRGYRRDLRRIEYGDERIASQRRKLDAISPLTRVDRIRAPLMVVTGANDPRVPPSEAEQIVAAIRARRGVAWQLLASDEGHGFARKPNADYQFLASVLFWDRYLLATGEDLLAASR